MSPVHSPSRSVIVSWLRARFMLRGQEISRKVVQRARAILSLPVLILLAATVLYTVYWSWVSIAKFYAMNASIYDLGVNAETLWAVFNLPWSPGQVLFQVTFAGWVFVASPLILFRSYPLLLVVQSAVLAAPVFPLYGAARRLLGRSWIAFLLAIGYLLYFPLAGVNWFDFHFEAFFPLLFLTGYYCYVTKHWRWAAFFLLLSGTVAYLYMIYPLLFALIIPLELVYDGVAIRAWFHDPRGRLALMLGGVALMFLGIAMSFGGSGVDQATGGYLHDASRGLSVNLDTKVLTLFLLLSPLLFLPVFSVRGVVLSTPFLYLLFNVNFPPFEYPALLSHQYVTLIVPFLWMGTMEGLRWILPARRNSQDSGRWDKGKVRSRGLHSTLRPDYIIPVALVVLLSSSAMVFEPYGPWNRYTTASFDLANATSVNLSLFNDVSEVLSMIPASNPNVLLQYNLPQALPGRWGDPPILPGFIGPEITRTDLVNNTFPCSQSPDCVVHIDYAVADLTHPAYFVNPMEPGFPGMATLLHDLLGSGFYGVEADLAGIVLVTRGFHGPPLRFAPFDRTIPATSFVMGPNMTAEQGVYCTNNFSSPVGNSYAGTTLWFGPYLSLAPGSYMANFSLYTNDNRSPNFMTLDVAGDSGLDIVKIVPVRSSLLIQGQWTTIPVQFNLSNFLAQVEFRGYTQNWSGTRCLSKVSLVQLNATIPMTVPTQPRAALGLDKDASHVFSFHRAANIVPVPNRKGLPNPPLSHARPGRCRVGSPYPSTGERVTDGRIPMW